MRSNVTGEFQSPSGSQALLAGVNAPLKSGLASRFQSPSGSQALLASILHIFSNNFGTSFNPHREVRPF